MTPKLADIPFADGPPEGERRKSHALRELPAPRSRRTVLRGIALSGLTVGTLALNWGSPEGRRAYAESGPGGLTGWDRNDCRDAYPHGYDEHRDIPGSKYRRAPAACFGSAFISSEYCANGWHRADEERRVGGMSLRHRPITGECNGKDSWRWRTPDGTVYRCSDGLTTITMVGFENTYFSICRAEVPA
jgi:hypothetical protein